MSSAALDEVFAAIERGGQRAVQDLARFVRQPSISARRYQTDLRDAEADQTHTLWYAVNNFATALGRLRFVTLASDGQPTSSPSGVVGGWSCVSESGAPMRAEQLLAWTPR